MFYPLRKINSTTVDVTTSSTLILPANEARKYCLIINDSNVTIYIKCGGAASLNAGVRISSQGFSYEITKNNLWVGEIYAIHGGSGTKKLLIEEYS